MAEKPSLLKPIKTVEPTVHHVDGKFKEDYYNKLEQKNSRIPKYGKKFVEHFDDSSAYLFCCQ